MASQYNKTLIRNIIDNLEMYPAIWDNSDPEYSDRDVRKRQMSDLAEIVLITVPELEKKYTSMRTRFRKEWNTIERSKKSGAGTAEVYKSKWEFYEDLAFLIPSLMVRDGTDNLHQLTTNLQQLPSTSSSSVNISVPDSEPEQPSVDEMRKKKRRVEKDDNTVAVAQSIALATSARKDVAAKRTTQPLLPPDVQGFLMTLGADLASITSIRTRRMMMMKINNLMFKEMFPNEETTTTTTSMPRCQSAPGFRPPNIQGFVSPPMAYRPNPHSLPPSTPTSGHMYDDSMGGALASYANLD